MAKDKIIMGNELLDKNRIILLQTNEINKARKIIEANDVELKEYRIYRATIKYDHRMQTDDLYKADVET